MKQCEDYNEINLYNTLVKKINEIIDELNKVDLQKLEMQRLLNTAYEIKNDLTKIYMDDKQVLDTINNNLKDVKDSVKLIKLLNIENKLNRLVKEFEGNIFTLTGSKNGVLDIESIQGNTLWVDNDTEEILTTFVDSKNLRLQSSFEDKVVTEGENADKYACQVKVVGKNKYKGKFEQGQWNFNILSKQNNGDICRMSEVFECKPITKYVLSGSAIKTYNGNLAFYDKDKRYLGDGKQIFSFKTFTTPNNAYYFVFHLQKSYVSDVNGTLQIEEGDTATTYEPYKEYTKTYYLNSPLLEGDTIQDNGNDVVHVHKYGKVVLDGSEDGWTKEYEKENTVDFYNFNCIPNRLESSHTSMSPNFPYSSEHMTIYDSECIKNSVGFIFNINKTRLTSLDVNGFKLWLQSNPQVIIYKLASPTVEVIGENDNDIMECFEGSSINYETFIPVEKTKVIYTGKEEITTYAMEDDISLNDSGIELNSNDEEVF